VAESNNPKRIIFSTSKEHEVMPSQKERGKENEWNIKC
jgi:hypothetical protein